MEIYKAITVIITTFINADEIEIGGLRQTDSRSLPDPCTEVGMIPVAEMPLSFAVYYFLCFPVSLFLLFSCRGIITKHKHSVQIHLYNSSH